MQPFCADVTCTHPGTPLKLNVSVVGNLVICSHFTRKRSNSYPPNSMDTTRLYISRNPPLSCSSFPPRKMEEEGHPQFISQQQKRMSYDSDRALMKRIETRTHCKDIHKVRWNDRQPAPLCPLFYTGRERERTCC